MRPGQLRAVPPDPLRIDSGVFYTAFWAYDVPSYDDAGEVNPAEELHITNASSDVYAILIEPGDFLYPIIRLHPDYAGGDISLQLGLVIQGDEWEAGELLFNVGSIVAESLDTVAAPTMDQTVTAQYSAASPSGEYEYFFYTPELVLAPAGTPDGGDILAMRIEADTIGLNPYFVMGRVWYAIR
jgi:hypothetical protein